MGHMVGVSLLGGGSSSENLGSSTSVLRRGLSESRVPRRHEAGASVQPFRQPRNRCYKAAWPAHVVADLDVPPGEHPRIRARVDEDFGSTRAKSWAQPGRSPLGPGGVLDSRVRQEKRK